MPLLDVSALAVRYGGVRAVSGVDLTVQAGRVSVLLGPNGAGKTSTMRAILGLVRKSHGRVTVDGVDVTKARPYRVAREGVALVPEGRRIFAPLSVEENLLLGAYTNRSAEHRAETLAQIFEMFPILAERRAGAAGYLSGGEQQMLAFGRALMSRPKVILMDEPSMGLSPAMVDVVLDAVRTIAGFGIGVLMVEQNAKAALRVADDGMVLERGRIVLRGSADELATHPDVVKAFLGEAAAGAAPEGTPPPAASTAAH